MNIAIVGVSGAVGQELFHILSERNFDVDSLYLFGSDRSVGQSYLFRNRSIQVSRLRHNDPIFRQIDLFFNCTNAHIIQQYVEDFVRFGAYVIDNSSAFRQNIDVPLIIPEINAGAIFNTQYRESRIIANPNCSTIMMALPLYAIHRLSPVTKVHVSTYQAASGMGKEAMNELITQFRQLSSDQQADIKIFPYQLAYNLIPHVDAFNSDGYTEEELKMERETQKIFDCHIKVSATCVRVPVLRCHSESVWVQMSSSLSIEEVRMAISEMPGCILQDDTQNMIYPMPLFMTGRDDIAVGRFRQDRASDNGVVFWCVGDQLRKGAALNAIQIAEHIVRKGWRRE